MSAKTLIIATAALAASTAMTLPAFAAGGDGTGPAAQPAARRARPAAARPDHVQPARHQPRRRDRQGRIRRLCRTRPSTSLDTNHDGKLTPDELGGRFGAMLGQRGGRGWAPAWARRQATGRTATVAAAGARAGWTTVPVRAAWAAWPSTAAPATAAPGQGPQGGPPSFADLDTNHDGVDLAGRVQGAPCRFPARAAASVRGGRQSERTRGEPRETDGMAHDARPGGHVAKDATGTGFCR